MVDEKSLAEARSILQGAFGDRWEEIAQNLGTENLRTRVGKELTSFMAFPDRGNGGDSKWRGNCSPKVIRAITKYVMDCKRYEGKDLSTFTLLDPMSGSGTSKVVADDLGIRSVLYDLNPMPAAGRGNWNALKDDVDSSADLIFWHPPYHSIIRYSGEMWGKPHPDDLSRCVDWTEFTDKLNEVYKKLFFALRNDGRLAVLVGDIKLNGKFYSMQEDMMKMGEFESFIVKAQFNCASDSRTYKKPFIPIVTEYLLVCKKDNPLIFQFTKRRVGEFDATRMDAPQLTWLHLVRSVLEELHGCCDLQQLYARLQNHPKAKANPHWKERIRATVYENPQEFQRTNNGCYKLAYAA